MNTWAFRACGSCKWPLVTTRKPTYRPHNHIQHCVIYTATHDHNTTVGWFTAAPGSQTTQGPQEVETEREYVLQYVGTDGTEITGT